MQQEERKARIRELLGSVVPGNVWCGEPVTLVVNVTVGRAFKKSE